VTEINTADLAGEAYLYYYPLVENLRQVQRYVRTGIGSNPAAPFNTFSHARKLAGPEDTFVTINNDTVYSMAQLDLSAGPVRLEVPDTGDRYYVLQFVDAWTNNIAYVGTRATGNQASRFLITPPGWDGQVPDGFIRIPASTTVLSIVGRFACAGPDDIPAANAVQDAVTLTPLAAAAPPLAGIPGTPPDTGEELKFWDQAWLWSQTFPAPPQDDHYAELYAPLHDSGDQDQDALVAGYRTGVEKLEYLTHHGSSPVNNGWTVGLHAFDYNLYALGPGTIDSDEWKITDPAHRIIERAVADRLGLWGNHAYEAVYAQAFTDIDGNPLDGTSTYTITFPDKPPVQAFWSITLYDIPQYYLVANPINRYSVGDRTQGIQYADDKSLTITTGNTEPGDPAAKANWLPAPAGRFRLVFRLYIPGPQILDGSYPFPPITKT
jgi:hypothetical protein